MNQSPEKFRPDLRTIAEERELQLRMELARAQLQKVRRDMQLDNWRFVLLVFGAGVALTTVFFTAETFFRPSQPVAPTINVFTSAERTGS